MGFFGDLGNWIWQGLFLNFFIGAISACVLFFCWWLLYVLLRFLRENDVYLGLISSEEDRPFAVAMLCLFTPPLLLGILGFGLSLIYTSIAALVIFLGNMIPFFNWGNKDAMEHFLNLVNLVEIPILVFTTTAHFLMSTPLLILLVLTFVTLVCFGYLFPPRENQGSLGHSNQLYAALSVSIFLSVFSVFLMLTFSSLSTSMYQHEIERFEEGFSSESTDEERTWYPNYTSQTSEGYEVPEGRWNSYEPLNRKTVLIESGVTGQFTAGSDSGIFSCLGLNSLSDSMDVFYLYEGLEPTDTYHVRVLSTHPVNISIITSSYEWSTYHAAHLTDLSFDFNTSGFSVYDNEWSKHRGFGVSLPEEHIPSEDPLENFSSVKYHLVYTSIGNSTQNETSAKLDSILSEMGNPTDCSLYALTGALEPRVRLTSLGYIFSGMFLFGCVFHRYFVVLGHNGTTDQRVLFRTFVQSQLLAAVVYAFFLVLIEPSDGTGVTGLRLERVVDTGVFVFKAGTLLLLVLMAGILGIALYRQRNTIGHAARAFIDHEKELRKMDKEWWN